MNKLALSIFLLSQSCFALAAIEDGRWHVGIGDPTIFGWLTVLVYLIAVIYCVKEAGVVKKIGGESKFWLFLALFLLFLGINKQLDLQSWLTQTAKDSALMHGWYAYRKPVQIAFIGFLGLGMLIALFSLRLFLANSWRHFKLTWVGIILLCTFILVRAASFHHFDIFINHHILGLKINVLLENGALLLIILGTFFNKKFVSPLSANTVTLKDYVVIKNAGDDAQCPRCGAQPRAKTVDGRLFKCRACGYKYTIRVKNS